MKICAGCCCGFNATDIEVKSGGKIWHESCLKFMPQAKLMADVTCKKCSYWRGAPNRPGKDGKVTVFVCDSCANGDGSMKKIKCTHCGYKWSTKSKHGFVSCPNCMQKVKQKCQQH